MSYSASGGDHNARMRPSIAPVPNRCANASAARCVASSSFVDRAPRFRSSLVSPGNRRPQHLVSRQALASSVNGLDRDIAKSRGT